jgi:hypothetical protein
LPPKNHYLYQCYFSQFFEVGVGNEHPKINLVFIGNDSEKKSKFPPNDNKVVTIFWGG